MSPELIAPQTAFELIQNGAMLVDVRTGSEYRREYIPEARNIPLDQLAAEKAALRAAPVVIFHCRTGMRTRQRAATLGSCVSGSCYLLAGGLDAWKRAGLPVVADSSQPLELQRQVQIIAGGVILLGTVLGATLSSWFLIVVGLIGAGLMLAGVTGFCGLARLLMRMPWNREKTA